MQRVGISVLTFLVMGTAGYAAVPPMVDFETLPITETGPVEGTVVTNQYWTTSGIRFSSLSGHPLVMARVGSPRKAFMGFAGEADTPQPGAGVGKFFVTDDRGGAGLTPGPFEIEYRWPVQIASATFLDVNGKEAWTAEAFDAAGVSRGVVTIWPTPAPGSAISWSIDGRAAVITKVRITFTGTAPSAGVTFGFDNFSGSRPPCTADLNGDGLVDFGDYLAFLDAYSGGDLQVDFTDDGVVDFSDFLAFLTAFDAGC